jgi:hypothetical protein
MTGSFIIIAKWHIMPPHRRPPTTAAQQFAALCKTSSSTSANQLDMFYTALVDEFAEKAMAECGCERKERVVTPCGVSTYSTRMSSFKKSVGNKVVAMELGRGGREPVVG